MPKVASENSRKALAEINEIVKDLKSKDPMLTHREAVKKAGVIYKERRVV